MRIKQVAVLRASTVVARNWRRWEPLSQPELLLPPVYRGNWGQAVKPIARIGRRRRAATVRKEEEKKEINDAQQYEEMDRQWLTEKFAQNQEVVVVLRAQIAAKKQRQ